MTNLIRADFKRMFKSKALYIGMIFMAGFAAYTVYNSIPIFQYFENLKNDFPNFGDDYSWHIDNVFFGYAPIIVIIPSIFTALFVGTDYSGGTIRNKVVAGYKRYQIYLSNLIVCLTANIFWNASYLTVGLAYGLPSLGGSFNCGIQTALMYMLVILFVGFSAAAIIVLISMLITNRTYSAIASVLMIIAMITVGSEARYALNEPEFLVTSVFVDDNGVEHVKNEPNPNYPGGIKRVFYNVLANWTPGGQAALIGEGVSEDFSCGEAMVADAVVILLTCGAGIMIFRKKDLK